MKKIYPIIIIITMLCATFTSCSAQVCTSTKTMIDGRVANQTTSQNFATNVIEYSGSGNTALILGGPRGGGAYQGSLHVLSLGNSGNVIVAFDVTIVNGPGEDFIVSENPFFIYGGSGAVFAELSYVEVSSDGIDFARFPSISLTPQGGQMFPENIENLAGVNPVYANVDENDIDPCDPAVAGGDAFDLNDLLNDPLVQSGDVDLQNINYIKLIDIVGDGSCLDSQGNPIYDPIGPGTNGADIDSVAVINYHEKDSIEWLTYQHDNKRSGATEAVGAAYNWEKKLTYNIGGRVLSPVVGDLDNDGVMEAVFSSDVISPNLPVYAVDLKTGNLKWSFMPDSAIWSTPTLADLNHDGKLDIVFGAGSNDAHIYALYHNGTEMWSYFTGDSTNSIDGHTGVADVDGDGNPEILVGGSCYYCPSCNTFFVLNGEDGSLLWGVNVGATLTAPAIGEFDGDSGIEIVIGGYDGYVRVFDGENGHEIWAIQPYAGGWIESTPAIVDYGSDGIDDIVVFSGNNIYLLDGSNGDTIWNYPTTGSGLFGGISAGDIDEDGELEILAYPYFIGIVYALNLGGSIKWTRDVGSDTIYASPSPAIADIDGDGHSEVIIQARSGVLYALNGDTGVVENSYSLGMQSVSSPGIVDSDGDGVADIITGCDDGKLYVIGNPWVNTNDPPNAPYIDGQVSGKIGKEYEYTFVSIDPDGDDIASYTIDWDDNSGFEVVEGPFDSGEIITVSHTWDEKGTYTIRAKAKDIFDAESDWGYLEVTMPRNKQSVNLQFLQLLERLFERFLSLEQLLSPQSLTE
jgi:outer membrane protein assembly factor BamB